MARNQINTLSFLFLCGLAASAVMAQGDQETAEIKKQTLSQMRATAQQFEIEVNDDAVELIADPIYRYSDPAREFDDGTIWAFGNKGRPAAIVTIAQDKSG